MIVYTASKVVHAPKWKALREMGMMVNSTWIDEAGKGESKNIRDLASRCVNECIDADILLLYCEPGETLKGALIEAGVALGRGKKVLCVGTCKNLSPVLSRHPNWVEVPSLTTAIDMILPATSKNL